MAPNLLDCLAKGSGGEGESPIDHWASRMLANDNDIGTNDPRQAVASNATEQQPGSKAGIEQLTSHRNALKDSMRIGDQVATVISRCNTNAVSLIA